CVCVCVCVCVCACVFFFMSLFFLMSFYPSGWPPSYFIGKYAYIYTYNILLNTNFLSY
ncbi:hypothetical protein EDC94DRAFT_599167, partial [Helicostylum pulchrum]